MKMITIDAKREKTLVLAGVFSLALAVRLIGAGQSFDSGEVLRLSAWKWNAPYLADFFRRDDNPPLFYLAAALWRTISESEGWMRLLPALASALTAVFLFLTVEIKITRTTAAVAALLFATHPLSVWSGQELSALSLAGLFVAVSAYFATIWLGTHGERAKVPTALFAVLALYTHYYAWFYVLFLALCAAGTLMTPGFRRSFAYRPVMAVVAAGLPWLYFVFSQVPNAARPGAHGGCGLGELLTALPFGSAPDRAPSFAGLIHFLPTAAETPVLYFFAAVVLVFAVWGAVRHPFFGFMFFTPLVLGVIAAHFAPVFAPKYMVPFLPAGIACVAAGIGEASKCGRPGQIAALGAAALFAGLSLLSVGEHAADARYRHTDWHFAKWHTPSRPREWVLAYSAESARDFDFYKSTEQQFKPLSPDDRTARDRGGAGLADNARDIAQFAVRVVLLDRDRSAFDPDGRVVEMLKREFGEPAVRDLRGDHDDRFLIFPPRMPDLPSLFWLTKW